MSRMRSDRNALRPSTSLSANLRACVRCSWHTGLIPGMRARPRAVQPHSRGRSCDQDHAAKASGSSPRARRHGVAQPLASANGHDSVELRLLATFSSTKKGSGHRRRVGRTVVSTMIASTFPFLRISPSMMADQVARTCSRATVIHLETSSPRRRRGRCRCDHAELHLTIRRICRADLRENAVDARGLPARDSGQQT